MQFYDYIYRDSVVHRLDPRTKILWLLCLSFLIFVTETALVTIGVFLIMVLLVLLSKLPLRAVWTSSKIFFILFPLCYIILFSLLLWDIRRGIVEGGLFAIKFLVLIVASILFAMSTSPRDLMLSLTKLKVPYELSFMLTLAMRFVPVIIREVNHVIDAQKARAHKIQFSFMHPVVSMHSLFPIIIPTLQLLLTKAFDLSLSIEARAFRSQKTRTYPPRLKFERGDYLAGIVLLFLAVAVFSSIK